jgi:hypothetical protein
MKERANPSPNKEIQRSREMNIYNEKQIISNIICLKIFVFAFMALLVCVWYYIYGVHGFYKLWKRKGLLTSSPFLFGN